MQAQPGLAGMVREGLQPGAEPVLWGLGLERNDSVPRSPTRDSLQSRIGQITESRGRSGQSGPRKTAGWARGRGGAGRGALWENWGRERRREVAEQQGRATPGGLRNTEPHRSSNGDVRKPPRPFVPRRLCSVNLLGQGKTIAHAQC